MYHPLPEAQELAMELEWGKGSSRRDVLFSAFVIAAFAIATLGAALVTQGQSSAAISESWSQQMIAQWQPAEYNTMSFGATIIPASYDQIEYSYNTPQVLQGYLSVMEDTGAGYVRIDVGYDPWLNGNTAIQAEVSSLVSQIHGAGKGFILADASAEAYRPLNKRLPWAEFKQAWVQRVTTLAQVLHPDYYVVVKEPGWYAGMISDVLTNPQVQDPNQWLGLTQNLTNAVHSVSPNTKVGIAIAADSLNQNPSLYVPYLEGLASLTGVDFMGFDIYTTTGFTSTQDYLSSHGSGGLAVWVAECWSASDAATVYNPSRATLDQEWILAQYYFAQKENVSMMVPFFTNTFASYSLAETSPTDTTQIMSLQQQRTPVFEMYKNITAGLENVPRGTTTTTTSTSATASTSTTTSPTSVQGGKLPVTEIALGVVVVLVLAVVGYLATRKRR
jgi:hypothetical protein